MIINFHVKEIESKIYVNPSEAKTQPNVNINYDINLRNINVATEKTPFGEKDVLRVEYAFTINYMSPSIGHIRFEGWSDYYNNDTDMAELKKLWDEGKAPANVQNEVANVMVSNLAPLAMSISRTHGLPPAIPIPAINFQQQQKQQQQAGDKSGKEQTTYHG
ncbi:MAG: hypothetical protein KAH86_05675 [Methanosarcinales archaeon]|nr:hypothetical protein [Methanosarcinales archaeon]